MNATTHHVASEQPTAPQRVAIAPRSAIRPCRSTLQNKARSRRTPARYLQLALLLLLLHTLSPAALWAQSVTPTAAQGAGTTTAVTPVPTLDGSALVQQQIDTQIEEFLQSMSPEERVGQLFVITFDGNTVVPTSDIAELIHDYHIGSVMLAPKKENYTNAKGTNTPAEIAALANQLQALAYGYYLPRNRALALTESDPVIAGALTMTETLSQTLSTTLELTELPLSPSPTTDGGRSASGTPTANNSTGRPQQVQSHIPLLIGVEQLGDGYPVTALRRNFTPIPSQLAMGSTWNLPLVKEVGAIVGQELHAVGINLLLGPSLDVTNHPRTDAVGALGVHTFGGDPYWVGKMGQSYIAGIHEGSDYQLAAIARHFPGQGDIDRLPEQEVATVQQSLSELRDIALPPFFQVTRQSSSVIDPTGSNNTADGLMTSHMRFSAFQGTSSTRVPPLSLMPDLSIVLEQEGFTNWHARGGILMTNALGVPAIRRYYEAPLQGFPYRRVALDAFAAGHDLIYLDQLSADNFWDTEREYIKDIVLFFRERYTADPNFQIQVDDAVRRILQLKFHLYHNSANAFTEDYKLTITDSEPAPAGQTLVPLHNVLVPRERLTIFEDTSAHRQQALAIVGQVARETVSVLYPELANLSEVIPAAPQSTDRLLIFSDSRLFSECADCTAETMLGPDELKGIITRLYGSDPGATGQLSPDNIHDRSFVELAAFLNATADTPVAEPPDAASVAGAAPITTTAPLTTETAILGRAVTETPATGIVTTPASVTAQPNLEVAATPVTGEEADNGQEQRTTGVTPNERLQTLINESNWIIFAMLDVDSTRSPGSDVVKQFLRQQSERLGDKKIVVLALNAPYFLDATEISKLTAYLGVYSKTQPFLESAVRAIFRSYTPTGAPAVSVPGTRFGNLEERLQPDPNFALPLTIISNDAPIEFSPDTNVAAPVLPVGALIRLQVDQVLDHNGHPVPDGVPVIFQLTYENEMTVPVEPVLTRNGSAMREIVLEQTGRLIISASAGEAQAAAPVILRVQDPVAEATAAAVAATPIVADGTTLPTATIALTATNGAPPAGETGPTELPPTLTSDWANWDTLIIALLTIMVTLSLLLILQIRILPRAMLVNNMLWATICGLVAYILYAMGMLPGVTFLSATLRIWSAAVVVFIGMLLPLLWLQLRAE